MLSNRNSGARRLNKSPLLPSGLFEAKCLEAVPPTQSSPAGQTATSMMSGCKLSFLVLGFFILFLSPRLTRSYSFFKGYLKFHIPNISQLNFYLFSEAILNFLSVPFILLFILPLLVSYVYVSFPQVNNKFFEGRDQI